MSVSAVSSTSTTDTSLLSGSDRIPKKTLGQDDFLKLLSVQFSAQDPLNPMQDTTFISQMASFSALENSTQLTNAFEQFSSDQSFSSAQNLLGRNVTVLDANSTEVSGVVSAVHDDGSGPLVTVNGVDYDVSTVRRVELASTDSTTPTTGN